MIQWQYYPRSSFPNTATKAIVDAFTTVTDKIDSSKFSLNSDCPGSAGM